MDYAQTPLNTVRRVPTRGHYDAATVHPIIDSALICHVAFTEGDQPIIIPTLHARDGEYIILHGSSKSRLMHHAASGKPLSIAFTHVDALVLARSVFNHSVNYRSVVVFGSGEEVTDYDEKMQAMTLLTNKIVAGRWDDCRLPNSQEMKATMMAKVRIEHVSAKVRDVGVKDDPEDIGLPYWAGLVPIHTHYGTPIPDPQLKPETLLPEYLHELG